MLAWVTAQCAAVKTRSGPIRAAEQLETAPSWTVTSIPTLRAVSFIKPGGRHAVFSQLGLAPLGQMPEVLKNVGSV